MTIKGYRKMTLQQKRNAARQNSRNLCSNIVALKDELLDAYHVAESAQARRFDGYLEEFAMKETK